MVIGHLLKVTFQSTNLAKAAFESKWYEGSLRYKKEILILMAQAQRPLEISARGVIIISLDTFKIVSMAL